MPSFSNNDCSLSSDEHKYSFSVSNTRFFGNHGFGATPGYGINDSVLPPPYSPKNEDNEINKNLKNQNDFFPASELPSSVSTNNEDDCMDVSISSCGSTPKVLEFFCF